MSIETEIKKLTAAIESLTKVVMDSSSTQIAMDLPPQQEVEVVEAEVVEAEVVEAEVTGVTHDDVKAKILELNRADKANKPKLKDLLARYNANKVADLRKDDLAPVMQSLNSGGF